GRGRRRAAVDRCDDDVVAAAGAVPCDAVVHDQAGAGQGTNVAARGASAVAEAENRAAVRRAGGEATCRDGVLRQRRECDRETAAQIEDRAAETDRPVTARTHLHTAAARRVAAERAVRDRDDAGIVENRAAHAGARAAAVVDGTVAGAETAETCTAAVAEIVGPAAAAEAAAAGRAGTESLVCAAFAATAAEAAAPAGSARSREIVRTGAASAAEAAGIAAEQAGIRASALSGAFGAGVFADATPARYEAPDIASRSDIARERAAVDRHGALVEDRAARTERAAAVACVPAMRLAVGQHEPGKMQRAAAADVEEAKRGRIVRIARDGDAVREAGQAVDRQRRAIRDEERRWTEFLAARRDIVAVQGNEDGLAVERGGEADRVTGTRAVDGIAQRTSTRHAVRRRQSRGFAQRVDEQNRGA